MILRFIYWLFGSKRYKKIDKKTARELFEFIWKTERFHGKQKVVEYDKIYHNTLKKLGYEWSFWEILKQKPKEISNMNEIWELHKFRNTLVHELRDFDERFIKKQEKRYEIILEKFIREVSK